MILPIQKKFGLPINSIPFSLKIKKDFNKKDKITNKPIDIKNILQNLPSYTYKNNKTNTSLLEKIKEKISREGKILIITKKEKEVENKNNYQS